METQGVSRVLNVFPCNYNIDKYKSCIFMIRIIILYITHITQVLVGIRHKQDFRKRETHVIDISVSE